MDYKKNGNPYPPNGTFGPAAPFYEGYKIEWPLIVNVVAPMGSLTKRERDKMLSNDARAPRTAPRIWNLYPEMAEMEVFDRVYRVHGQNSQTSRQS